jgi:hypothetical protein
MFRDRFNAVNSLHREQEFAAMAAAQAICCAILGFPSNVARLAVVGGFRLHCEGVDSMPVNNG